MISLASFNRKQRVSLEERYLLVRQLAVLQRAGVPLLSSLHALREQVSASALELVLAQVCQDLADGKTFSQALARHPATFNAVFLGLIRVGEAGGLLEEVLKQLSQLLEWEIDLRNRLREALQYPLIVLLTLSLALTILLVFVLPRFAEMFRSFKIELPLQTRLLIALGGFVSKYGWLCVLLLIAAIIGIWRYIRTESGRLRWHTWKLKLPILGPVFMQIAISRFARITASLNHSGVPILETLALTSESVNNKAIGKTLNRVCAKVQGGATLAGALKTEPLFSAVVVQMVSTGEETGRVDELLQSLSEYYDQQVAYAVRKLVTYLEPLLLLFVGAGVLVMASAVFVPMWDLVKIFKH
ncbi:MAG: type II secretion system F family protein [Candidatus Omnitrophica bacterium]|nr:type II secretion system F family protein [Candidatus Omnitrophota bacterium]MBI2173656.1 type II secretion system F family protein [Candidatus Omnitrophota bacterium]